MSDQSIITTAPETDIQIARENAAFELLQRQAKMFAASSLVPKDFIGNVANCAIGVNIAKRLGADPFMVLQNIDIIHGRPSFRATFLIAMVNAAGRFDPLQFRMEGEEGKPNRSCVAWTKSKDGGDLLEGPKITLEMAKAEGWSTKNGSKWLTMPELMLRYRAAAFFARLYAPDITLGMQTAEEVQDALPARDVTPASTSKLLRDVPVIKDADADEQVTNQTEYGIHERLNIMIGKAIATDGLTIEKLQECLVANGVLSTEKVEDFTEFPVEKVQEIIAAWPAILKMVKGGKK